MKVVYVEFFFNNESEIIDIRLPDHFDEYQIKEEINNHFIHWLKDKNVGYEIVSNGTNNREILSK